MIAWVAFALALLELVFLVLVVLASRKFWRQMEPMVRPLLAMFSPPATSGPPVDAPPLVDGAGSSSPIVSDGSPGPSTPGGP